MADQDNESLFSNNDATGVTNPPATPQDSTDDGGTTTHLETLVGEGKKFKSAEDLARGKLEADSFITKLQSEAQEMREELNKRLAVEDVLKRIEERQKAVEPDQSNRGTPDPEEKTDNRGVSMDDVAKLVQQQMEEKDLINTRRSNLASVKDKLVQRFGADYANKVRGKLSELGLGDDFANGLAATQPNAFLALVGAQGGTPATTGAEPKSTVRLGGDINDKRTYEYYQKLRREDPAKYFESKVQMQMHRDAAEQGEDFYS